MQATIRTANLGDIPRLAELWHEKMIIQQQFDSRFALAGNSVTLWSAAMCEWLQDGRCAIYVGVQNMTPIAYIIGWIQTAPPGLHPAQIGAVTDLTIDLHAGKSNLGRDLLTALRIWFNDNDIQHIIAYVPNRSPIEQAFWRGLGATEWSDLMWMKL